MGALETKGHVPYERRIGTRIAVAPIEVAFLVPRTGLFRSKLRVEQVAGRVENVSVTGAAVSGPDSLPWQPGDEVALRVDGHDDVVVVRHRQTTPGGALFGVELTRRAAGLERRISGLLPAAPGVDGDGRDPSRPLLGLRRDQPSPDVGAPTSEASGVSTTPAVDAPPEPVIDLTEPRTGPVLDLTGAEPVIDLTDRAVAATGEVDRPTTPPSDEVAGPTQAGGRQVLDDMFGLMDDD